MAIMGGAVTRQSLTLRAWSSTCIYITIYGVALFFLVGPATQSLAALGSPATHRVVVFALWLVTAAVLTVGAVLMNTTVNSMLERRYQDRAVASWRVETAFAARGVLFAILAAALFVAIGSMATGGVSGALLWAAVLAFVIPGTVAGVMTHSVIPTVLNEKRQVATVSSFALVVVALSNYVLVGAVEPLNSALGV